MKNKTLYYIKNEKADTTIKPIIFDTIVSLINNPKYVSLFYKNNSISFTCIDTTYPYTNFAELFYA